MRIGQSQGRGLGATNAPAGCRPVRHLYFSSLKIGLYLPDIHFLLVNLDVYNFVPSKIKSETDIMTIAGPCHSGLDPNTALLNPWPPEFFLNKMLHPMIL